MEEKVLLLILDGFSSKFLEKNICPNLYKIAQQEYYSPIQPLFGFQGIGAAIFSGASMNTTGVFTEYVLKSSNHTLSPLFQMILKATDYIPNDWLCAVSRHQLCKLFGVHGGVSNVMPSRFFKYFSPKLTKPLYAPNSLGKILTIFDVLRLNGLTYFYSMPSLHSESFVFNEIIRGIKRRALPNLTVVHFCSLDIAGHDFGPNSRRVFSVLQELDLRMALLYRHVKTSRDSVTVITISDHGMIPVKNYINIMYLLKNLPLAMEKDYLVFLDSTVARFWFFKENAKKLITDRLLALRCGKILDAADMKKLRIDKLGLEYGELFFALNEGWVFHPDFFRKYRIPKGMHGYAFSSYDAPIFIAFSSQTGLEFKKKRDYVEFMDIMPTILDLLNLPIPATCEGVSLR